MKRQMKIAAVVSATALLAIGASFTSMAALKNGTWKLNEEGWQYVNREGIYETEEWCLSNGIEYWINEDGVLGSSEWVTDTETDHTYYVQTDGSKAKNVWKYIYAEDDEEAEEESWFYFDAKGRMVKNGKRAINGSTYYFDENGKMLTGWIEYTTDDDGVVLSCKAADKNTDVESVVFCDENGALVKSAWLNEFPWTEDADNLYEGEDEEWYYAKSNGAIATGKQSSINGQTYFFNKETGIMLEGWVVKKEAGLNDDGKMTYVFISSNGSKFSAEDGVEEVYFATEDGDGHAKKNGWKELTGPVKNDDDYWYYFDKLGKAFLAKTDGTDEDIEVINVVSVEFTNGEKRVLTPATELDPKTEKKVEKIVKTNSKKINNVEYYFNADGEMIDGLVKINDKLMYLDGGAAQTGKVTLTDIEENDYTFYFAEKTVAADGYVKYVAINGNKGNFCYMNGQLVTSDESGTYEKVLVENSNVLVEKENADGEVEMVPEKASFIVDSTGRIQHKDGKSYEGVDKAWYFNANAKGWKEDSVGSEYIVKK